MGSTAIIGKKIIHYREIDSTNDEAKRLVKKGLGEGVVVVADCQSKGRGKPGNRWYSPEGVGVYLSVVVKPFRNIRDLSSITILGARAAVAAIEKVSGLVGKIELPNDVFINGKKVGGILTERLSSGQVIIGIGINVNNEKGSFPDEIAESATSLKIESGKKFSVEKFIDTLISEINREYLEYLGKV